MENVSQQFDVAFIRELLLADFATRQALLTKRAVLYQDLLTIKQELDYHLNSDRAYAFKLAQLAFEVGNYLASPEARALAHWSLALGQTAQGEFDEALEHFTTARALYREQGLEIEAHKVATRQLQALAMQGDFDKALALASETEKGFRQHQLLAEAAKVQNNVGIIRWRRGDYQEAIATLQEVHSLYASLGNELELARTAINLGNVYQDIDDFAKARHYFQQAIYSFEKLDNSYLLAGALVALALTYRREGRLGLVLDSLSKAKALFAAMGESLDLALAQLEEARVRFDLNLLEEAEALSRELLHIFAERNMQLEKLETETLLGMTLAKRHNKEAYKLLKAAQEGWLALGNEVQSAWVQLYLATYVLDREEASPELIADLELALRALEDAGSKAGKAVSLMLLAKARQKADSQMSLMLLQEAESLAKELAIPDLMIRSAHLLGLVASSEARLEVAESKFRQAIDSLENVRASLNVDEFKAAYFGNKLEVYNDLIALLLNQQRFADAFHFVERSKARALLDLLGTNLNLEPTEPHSQALLEQLSESRAKLNAYYVMAEKEGPQGSSWSLIRETERQVTALRQELERLSSAKGVREATVPSASIVQEKLSKGQTLIEFFALGEELLAFVVDGQNIRCIRNLGLLSELKAHLDRLSFTMSRVSQGQMYEQVYSAEMLLARVNSILKALYDQLIQPLELEFKGQQIIIVPYGSLHGVPFSALFDGKQYLLDLALLALAPSAAVYLHCLEQQNHAENTLLAFGIAFEDIPAVEAELTAVADLFEDAQIFLGKAASLAQFQELAPTARVLHIATHGVFRPDNPMFSGLRFHDGWLAARDLYQQKLNASLVVLSACETGMSSHASDEVFGLARGFLFAGTPCLIVSLWAVKDTQTAMLMVTFYSALKAGKTVAEALKSAQTKVREAFPNPYFWSAFNVLGDSGRTLS